MRNAGGVVAMLLGLMTASQAVAAGSHVCTAAAISDCNPAGCTEVKATGSITLDLAARTHRFCFRDVCRSGLVEAYFATMKAEEKGYVGFAELGHPGGFTGAINLDTSEFTIVDGTRFWQGRCVAR